MRRADRRAAICSRRNGREQVNSRVVNHLSLCGLVFVAEYVTLTQQSARKSQVGGVGIKFWRQFGGVLAPAVTGYVAHTQSFAMA